MVSHWTCRVESEQGERGRREIHAGKRRYVAFPDVIMSTYRLRPKIMKLLRHCAKVREQDKEELPEQRRRADWKCTDSTSVMGLRKESSRHRKRKDVLCYPLFWFNLASVREQRSDLDVHQLVWTSPALQRREDTRWTR